MDDPSQTLDIPVRTPRRALQRLQAAVTFEYELDPPETWRGEIVVSNPRLGARRAVEAAQRVFPNRHWSSMVVLLDRSLWLKRIK